MSFPPTLALATRNAHKIREIVEICRDWPVEWVTAPDARAADVTPDPWPDVEETGQTYLENALLKARAVAVTLGIPAVADDSGLEVDALGGAPGLHSARFGGPGLDDAGRVALLLERVGAVPPGKRAARFRCVIALVDEAGVARSVEGVAEGEIAPAPRGMGGFGYDPVFFYPPLGRTFGELSDDDKDRVSHRALAARAARALLRG